ncbi:hypothetical protein B0T17DRAFT_506059 [Bombardia bombarda]|uniref:Uncharacterized protein n=1 Tax=Bombardia bombarda TaxID=252184 RepID=A0AA39X910_9PEZI|nr:hypothetical protein B0T17DRAFT_506059 [Bombardia bombarda]
MNSSLRLVTLLLTVVSLASTTPLLSEGVASHIIVKDVAITGGGASGSYAAIRLKEDLNKTIILIKKSNHLKDYGPTKAFFARINVSVGTPGRTSLVPQNTTSKKLLVAIEPTATNMASFALDTTEKSVFDNFQHSTVHAGIVSHPSLPVGGSLVNTPAAAAPNNTLELPKPNLNARLDYLGPGPWRVLLVGSETFGTDAAQALVRENLQSLVTAGTMPTSGTTRGTESLEIKTRANHGAMHMRVPAAELRDGFV